MAKNVFENDDGVVDQPGEGQRESAEHHGVDAAATSAQGQKRSQGRKRNGKENGGGGPEAAEEKQNHQTREDEADASFAKHVGDGCFDESLFVKKAIGNVLLGNVNQMLESAFDAIDDGDGVGIAALFENGKVDGALPIHSYDVGLDGLGVYGFADIADKHRGLRLADTLERHGVDVRGRRSLAVGIEVVIVRTDFDVAGGKNQVGVVDFAHHVHGTQLMRLELQRIDVNHDLAIAPAERLREIGRASWRGRVEISGGAGSLKKKKKKSERGTKTMQNYNRNYKIYNPYKTYYPY